MGELGIVFEREQSGDQGVFKSGDGVESCVVEVFFT
jgi:hypothetical protein